MFAVALASRLYGIESRSLWMDEDAQARRVLRGELSLDLVARAATQQQPPLDYFAQWFGFELFGVTPLGARVHAAVFGALAVLCFFWFARRVFGYRAPLFFGTALMLLHPTLIYYSQEGRPIACGVLFGILFLSNLHGFLMLPGTLWRRAGRAIGLLISTWCFLLSVGMQPVILIAAVALALCPALFARRLRSWIVGAWLILAAAFALAWPVLSAVIAQSPRYVERASLAARLLRVLARLAESPFPAWRFQLGEMVDPHWPMVLVLVGLGSWGVVSDLKQRRQSALLVFTGFIALVTLVFPWLIAAIFAALVKNPLKPRYVATLVPFVVMLLALLLHYAIPVARRLAGHSRVAKVAVVATLVAVLGWTCVRQGEATLAGYTRPKQDWASVYALFKNSPRRGVAYMLDLRPPDKSERAYYCERFYYKQRDTRPVQLSRTSRLRQDFKRNEGPLRRGNVYVVVVDGWKSIRPLQSVLETRVPGVTFHAFPGASVIELHPAQGGRRALREVFEVLVDSLAAKSDVWRAYQTLAWLRFEDGDPAGARELALRLEKLHPKLKRPSDEILRAVRQRLPEAKL